MVSPSETLEKLKFIVIRLKLSPCDQNLFTELQSIIDHLPPNQICGSFPFVIGSISEALSKLDNDQKQFTIEQESTVEILARISQFYLRKLTEDQIGACRDLFVTKISLVLNGFFQLINEPSTDTVTESTRIIKVTVDLTEILVDRLKNTWKIGDTKLYNDEKCLLPVFAFFIRALLRLNARKFENPKILSCVQKLLQLDPKFCSIFLPGVCALFLTDLESIKEISSTNNAKIRKFGEILKILSYCIKTSLENSEENSKEWTINARTYLGQFITNLIGQNLRHTVDLVKLSLLDFSIELLRLKSEILSGDCQENLLKVVLVSATENLSIDDRLAGINIDFYKADLLKILISGCKKLGQASSSDFSLNFAQEYAWQEFFGCLKLLGSDNIGDIDFID